MYIYDILRAVKGLLIHSYSFDTALIAGAVEYSED